MQRIRSKKAISPIIATLLLILIAIAAGVVVYAYVVGFIGSSTTNSGGSTNTLSVDQVNLASSASKMPATVYLRNLGPGTEPLNTGFYVKGSTINVQLAPAVALTLLSGTVSVTNVALTATGSNTIVVGLTCAAFTGTVTVTAFGTSGATSACPTASVTLTLPTGVVVSSSLATANVAFTAAVLSASPIIVGVGITAGTITVPINTVMPLTLAIQGEQVASGAGAGQANEPLTSGTTYTVQVTGTDGSSTTASAKSS